MRIVSIFGREWYFDSIRIDNPVAQIFVDKNGVSNLPTFKSSNSSSNTTVFDLGIRHAVLANGAVFYNNRPSSLALDLRDVQFNARFNSLLQEVFRNTRLFRWAARTTQATRRLRTRSTCNLTPRPPPFIYRRPGSNAGNSKSRPQRDDQQLQLRRLCMLNTMLQ